MIRLFATLLVILTGGSVLANSFPSTYQVAGVATDDTLNIRMSPDAGSVVIGEYASNRQHIEVLHTDPSGAWARVGLGEGMGWVSMTYLARMPPPKTGAIPRPMHCGGTEPFWSLSMRLRGDEYATPDGGLKQLLMTHEQSGANGYLATFAEGPRSHRTLIVHRTLCNDGMSDRDFGFRATLFNALDARNVVETGCCTLDSAN